jgi:hypothetical protein
MEGLGSIASDLIQWLLMVAISQWWLLLLLLCAALLLGLQCWRSRMERQKKFPVDIDVRNPLNDEVKALLDDTRDLSDEDEQKVKKDLQQRLECLRIEWEDEKDARKRRELEAKIGEIEAVLAHFEKLMRWMKFHVSELNTVIGREEGKIRERREQAAKEFEVALTTNSALEGTEEGREEPRRLSKAEEAYRDQLGNGERRPIGLAFSSGGIRSATFNLAWCKRWPDTDSCPGSTISPVCRAGGSLRPA